MRVLPVFAALLAAATAAGAAEPPADTLPGPTPPILAELPYLLGKRPRFEGPVVASVADEDLARWNVGGSSAPGHLGSRPGFHAAPRVFVETKVHGGLPERSRAKGTLSAAGVLAQTRNHGYWPFRLCYESELARSPKLRGEATVRVSVARSGRAQASRVLESDEPLREVARCLAEKARSLRFTPGSPRRFDVDVTVELSPGDAPLPERPAPEEPAPEPAAGARAKPALRPDFAAVGRSFEPARARIAECYEAARKRDPELWGRLALRVSVGAEGSVTAAAEHDSRFPAPDVVACGRDALLALRVPGQGNEPRDLVWAVRLGRPRNENEAGKGSGEGPANSTVAESTLSRVRVGP